MSKGPARHLGECARKLERDYDGYQTGLCPAFYPELIADVRRGGGGAVDRDRRRGVKARGLNKNAPSLPH